MVYNDKGDTTGSVEDLVIAPDPTVSKFKQDLSEILCAEVG
jgi:hypothetical protein